MSLADDGFRFPAGFLWGTSTSSFQVEGDNSNNDWWLWEQSVGRVAEGHRSGTACEWWSGRAEEDFARAAETGQNAHRLSIEWSRVEPSPGVWDEQAIERYRQMVRRLRLLGLIPMVTLHHFTNPIWLSERGGWTSSQVVQLFERYVRKVVAALADEVDFWCTINEPNVYVYCSCIEGYFPPGKPSLFRAFRVTRNMVRAHAAAYHVIHELQPSARVGIALNVRIYDPADPSSILDRAASSLYHHLTNEIFPQALHDGWIRVPMPVSRVPAAVGTLDYLGVNYYTRSLVAFSPRPRDGFGRLEDPPGIEMGDGGYGEIYPEGMYRALSWSSRFGKPIYVTENGLPDAADRYRPRFLVTHIGQVRRAMREGLPVLGYFHWSLLDNFEWERGWTSRFGLWELDRETQRRTLRPSGRLYAEICAANGLTGSMIRRYAPELAQGIDSPFA